MGSQNNSGTNVKNINNTSGAQTINNNNNTSIELVSKNGPLPINVMMQEGVKALTKILSNQLQDRKAFEKTQHSMQFVIRSNQNSNHNSSVDLASLRNQQNHSPVIDANLDDDDSDENRKSNIEYIDRHDLTDNEGNIILGKHVQDYIDEEFLDPQLHINGEEAEIIFDYETQGIDDETPDGISQRISEMIESVLPNGFTADANGQLHTIIDGNQLNIEELDKNINSLHNQNRNKKHHYKNGYIEENIDGNDIDIIDEDNIGGEDNEINDPEDNEINVHSRHHPDNDNSGEAYNHEACCPHHQNTNQRGPSKFKNYNYHDFDYITSSSGTGYNNNNNNNNHRRDSSNKYQHHYQNIDTKTPDFSILLNQDKPMCMFCEYYMVFGEPPKNMIKWYNNMFGYNRLPPSNRDRQHHQHMHQQNQRKRNR